ncbi:protein FAM204A-like isoform X2 [Dreissena polymorpha]|uniref:protein FAM204A-like isoform X2 n=1 Tax=Dreissena polymorpha TaxID=45954 RepID=UPI002264042D|nr:protein FAM204A-like isoform X2 [Dreissena polymorpha]
MSMISNEIQRFKALEKRTNDVTKRSTEKRIKHLQKNILQTVQEKLSSEEEKDILRQHNVSVDDSDKLKCEPNSLSSKTTEPDKKLCDNVKGNADSDILAHRKTDKFAELNAYLGVNDHLLRGVAIDGGVHCGLERQVEEAIKVGHIGTAEQLSDRLAMRNYAVRIAEAAEARDYMKRKKEEGDLAKAKKKQKLHWGFDHKQRWETKSNM